MGEVWEARDELIGRRVAVKLLPQDGRAAPGTALSFREARTAGALNHPGVVTVHDVGRDEADGALFLVMEYLDGRDLASVLREDGPPSTPTAVDWAAQIAAALARAHDAGIVHRDLKPANLMLTAEGRVKVLDFGIARFAESAAMSSQVMGTLAYMAPERFDGQPGDTRSDLYSFGCVLHELFTGRIPFDVPGPVPMMNAHLNTEPGRPSEHRPGVPPAIDDLVLALLAKDPDQRPGNAHEALKRLRPPHAAGTTVPRIPQRRRPPLDLSSEPTPESPAPDDAPSNQRDDRPSDSPDSPTGSMSVQRRSMSPAGVTVALAVAVAVASLAVTAVVLGSDSRRNADVAATATVTATSDQAVVGGNVSCTSGNLVVGVWVEATRGSGFAFIRLEPAGSSSYQYTLPSSETYTLHVGCGGTSKDWAVSVNDAPQVSGRRNSFICNDIRDRPGYGTCTTQ
ncbi:serine/threonine-protein kinase [Embleya sp. NBC_00896]|uniref:serine/threonine-protein kinase n=1 Tax=Embleya sp. NBC_00896 TaxID=2975961 RepID=UPI00386EB799